MNLPAPPVRAGDELRLEIADLAFGGRGVARASGFVVFVKGALPGEVARVRVRRVRPGAGGRPLLGLPPAERAGEILPIEPCLLMPEPVTQIRTQFARRAAESGLSSWDARRRRGFMRRLGIQMARATGEILITLETGRGDPPGLL